ncbi:DUF6884 domain-containing protein [Nocardiopsis sp. FR6]|uniref:DUF6884 domain-containing protein n=1 Tax=Nocardiopsis sp. FR6 TaxID=2605986 RepID=UPI00135A6740|nr:DUF6884 domain-containing protein [Nocardiopsis sp. FR6]
MLVTPGLVIVGCSREKKAEPAPALSLYEGWGVPPLRARIGSHQECRRRVMILSARHGLLNAEETVAPYDQAMTPERARQLRPATTEFVRDYRSRTVVEEALLLVAPEYLDALPLADLAAMTHLVCDPLSHWELADAVLSGWGWP